MGPWMEYLNMQAPIPATAKGVEVTLDAVSPNGNFVHIGDVTSDMSGMFSYVFTPEGPGKYTIIATFPGSAAYGSSYAETAIGVTAAAAQHRLLLFSARPVHNSCYDHNHNRNRHSRHIGSQETTLASIANSTLHSPFLSRPILLLKKTQPRG